MIKALLDSLRRQPKSTPPRVGVFFGRHYVAIGVVSSDGDKLIACDYRQVPRNQQTEALAQLVARADCGGSPAFVVLDGSDYQTRQIEAPGIPDAELAGAIRFRLKDLVELPLEQLAVAAHRQHSDRRQQESRIVLAAVASKARLAEIATSVAAAGLHLEAVLTRETALHDLTAHVRDAECGVATLYVDDEGGVITVSRGPLLYLARNHPITRGELATPLEAGGQRAIERLALEALQSIDYYDSQLSNLPAARLVVAPIADAGRDHLLDHLNQTLAVPCAGLDLFQLLEPAQSGQTLDPATQAHGLMAVAGALRRPSDRAVSMYRPTARKLEPLSAPALAGYLAVGVIALVVTALLLGWRAAVQERQLEALTAERLDRVDAIATLEAQHTARDPDPALVRRQESLTQEIRLRQHFISQLEGLESRALEGFSPALRTLSAQQVDRLWLTHIRLAPGQVYFEGRALQPERIAVFFNALAEGEAFADDSFDGFRLLRPQTPEFDDDTVRFQASTGSELDELSAERRGGAVDDLATRSAARIERLRDAPGQGVEAVRSLHGLIR